MDKIEVRKSANIFLHFLNRDTQEIFGQYGYGIKLKKTIENLRRALNACILLIDTDDRCILPPGFWYESEYTRKLLYDCADFFRYGYIVFSIRESDLIEFTEKKRKQYRDVIGIGQKEYDAFDDGKIFKKLTQLDASTIYRGSQIGLICMERWDEEHNQLIEDGVGSLENVYRVREKGISGIELATVMSKAVQDKEKPFIWRNVQNVINAYSVRDKQLISRLRNHFEKNYYEVYLNEYDAVILQDCYVIDRRIDFGLGMPPASIANYRWLEVFLRYLHLEILGCNAEDICMIKSSFAWAYLFKKYVECCNETGIAKSFSEACLTGLSEDNKAFDAVRKIKEQLETKSTGKIFFKQDIVSNEKRTNEGKNMDSVDVLVIIATLEEERAILENDKELTKKKDSTGYEYYVKNKPISLALVRSASMGEPAAASMTQRFISALNPKYVAMVGFCAGRKGSVNLGDVIVCEKVYRYGTGKQVSENELEPEILSYNMDSIWKQKAERFGNDWRSDVKISAPITYDEQRISILQNLKNNGMEMGLEDIPGIENVPDYKIVVSKMCDDKELYIDGGSIKVADTFQSQIDRTLFFSEDKKEPTLRVGCLATGLNVQQWEGIFDKLVEKYDRKTVALDMEATAIAEVAQDSRLQYIIAKGVGDFAGTHKKSENKYIEYAVYSAYAFTISFFCDIISERG